MREGDALPLIEKSITQEQVERYAKASGDYNPIHIDVEFAAESQFGRRIAHGMMIAASISEMMTAAFKEDWLRGGRLKIRFRAPVYPGETITTFGQVKSIRQRDEVRETTCSVGVRKQNGETAIIGDAIVSVLV
jgi:3-hydroxybutyryl-CoA dehydratase